jgi:hypothetical protein
VRLVLNKKITGQIGALNPKSNQLDTRELVRSAFYIPGKRRDRDQNGFVYIFTKTWGHLSRLATASEE